MSEHSTPATRISGNQIAALLERLSSRDLAVLRFLSAQRYASTAHLQRVFFTDHATPSAATRATVRVLDRLLTLRLITRMERKIGGSTRGSAAYIWHLDSAGERLTRRQNTPRRRYTEPALPYLDHNLQVTETVVALHELTRGGDVHLSSVAVETAAWRSFLTARGTTAILKPDLYAKVSTETYDDHWYIEVDRGTEHLPVLLAKCRTYAAYKSTGRAKTEHGVFPRVLWIVPTQRRVERLTAAIRTDKDLPARVFTVITPDQLDGTIRDAPELEAISAPERRNQ